MIKYTTINIRKDTIEENLDYINELMNLSYIWEQEQTMPSYISNEKEYYIDKDLFIAYDEGKIIGYIVGNKKIQTKKTSYNSVGDMAFTIDEIYVLKEYRNKGIGKTLYQFLEDILKDTVDFIHLTSASYDYKSLLKFYVDELEMEFKYAVLVKRL